MVKHTKLDSPLKGWPMSFVQRACDNVTKNNQGKDVKREFPLCCTDLKPVIWQMILPLTIAVATTNGLMIIGEPGVCKTMLAIIMQLIVGGFFFRPLHL